MDSGATGILLMTYVPQFTGSQNRGKSFVAYPLRPCSVRSNLRRSTLSVCVCVSVQSFQSFCGEDEGFCGKDEGFCGEDEEN